MPDSTSKTSFTWEHGPFETCPKCEADKTFGILSVGRDAVRLRCTRCRYGHSELLPTLDKRVIYLDQFAFSELHKLRAETRKADRQTEFWERVSSLLNQALLLQQIVLPHSNIHHDETIVSPFAKELRDTQEHIGGDIEFVATDEVQFAQVESFAKAFASGTEPQVDVNVDEVLIGDRNIWLPDMRITVPWDWSSFAAETRSQREKSGNAIASLVDRWIAKGMDFEAVLQEELGAYYSSRIEGLLEAQRRLEAGLATNDIWALLNFSQSFSMRELQLVRHLLVKAGVPEGELTVKVREFWQWDANKDQPFGKMLAYLFAALADQFANGRKKKPSPGFMNDVSAISAYAPFVDAMFIDNECAQLLRHTRCQSELNYRARIFSINKGNEFLDYLEGVIAATPANVRQQAERLYGL